MFLKMTRTINSGILRPSKEERSRRKGGEGDVMKMRIKGKYTKDDNFIDVYCDNAVYTIARNTGEWGVLKVGERSAMGQILDQATYDKLAAQCEKAGEFVLR